MESYKQSFQNSGAQQQWSIREVLKFPSPYAYAKVNTCYFPSTDLAAPCSLYLLFVLQILPDSVLSCSYLLSTARLTRLQLCLPPPPAPFFFYPPTAYFLSHMSNIPHTWFLPLAQGWFLKLCNTTPQAATKH